MSRGVGVDLTVEFARVPFTDRGDLYVDLPLEVPGQGIHSNGPEYILRLLLIARLPERVPLQVFECRPVDLGELCSGVRNAGGPIFNGALTISATSPISVSSTLITDCAYDGTGVTAVGASAPAFTNVNLTKCGLYISDNSHPTFTGGIWDGGGTLMSAGQLDYNSGTPDPSFNGITLQNYVAAPAGRAALDINSWSSISGATHWKGIPFWIPNRITIAPTGQVDAANTTLLFNGPSGLDVNGTLNLGATAQPVELKSNDPSATPMT